MSLSALPQRHFGTIVADPPWGFKGYTAIQSQNPDSTRAVERHYETMTLDDICALPVKALAAPSGCHLWLWTTGPNLPHAFRVIDAWGFKYSGLGFVWCKLTRGFGRGPSRTIALESAFHVGLGLTTRHNAELCLLARRGNAKRLDKTIRELIVAPVREHSRKPDEAYERAQRYSAGPYLELFARASRPGWTTWGDEATRFDRASNVG